jgi:hypothetical protein
MFINTVRHFAMGACLVCCGASANAAPVSYAFSGTLSQPYNGSSQVSGTFTYDTDLTRMALTEPKSFLRKGLSKIFGI